MTQSTPPTKPSVWRAIGILPALLLGMAALVWVMVANRSGRGGNTGITADDLARQAPAPLQSDVRVAPDPIHWTENFNASLALAEKSGKPVLLDFTADWCPPCQAMKREIYAAAGIRELIESLFVPVKIDLTKRDAPNAPVAQRMNVEEIPTLIVLTPGGAELSRFTEEPTVENFRRWLKLMATKGTRPPAPGSTAHG